MEIIQKTTKTETKVLKKAKVIHSQLLHDMIEQVQRIDFFELAFPESVEIENKINIANEELNSLRISLGKKSSGETRVEQLKQELEKLKTESSKFILKEHHFLVISVRAIMGIAYQNQWGLTNKDGACYLFNGAFWKVIPEDEMKHFLSEAAKKLGIDEYKAEHFEFTEKLYKQYVKSTFQWQAPKEWANKVQLNLLSGTLEIENGKRLVKPFDKVDFMTYQMGFDYDPSAEAPIFQNFINHVLPDISAQQVLFEYLAYIFISPRKLKLEKVLFLYGSGANGKSVIYETVNALLGKENITSFSLDQLTDTKSGYYRAMIANVRLNYVSEYTPADIDHGMFKIIASGEPINARHPYGKPFEVTDYAKLIFNANRLPKKVDHINAFFRRFLILPFNVTIPIEQQDAELSRKIANTELPGFLNLILEGMDRLLINKKFTHCDLAEKTLEDFKRESDSVALFIDDRNYTQSSLETIRLKDLHDWYSDFCKEDNYMRVSSREMKKRLENMGFKTHKTNTGIVIFMKYNNDLDREEGNPF